MTSNEWSARRTLRIFRSKAIKGPGLKIDLDVRRVWECPACGRRVKRKGSISSYQCHCEESPLFMRLVEGQRGGRPYQPHIVPEIDADEILGDEDPVSSDVPTEKQPTTVVETVTPPDEKTPATEEVVSPNPESSTTSPTPETMSKQTAPSPDAKSGSSSDEGQSPEASPGKKSRKGRSRRRRSRNRNRKPGSEGSSEGKKP